MPRHSKLEIKAKPLADLSPERQARIEASYRKPREQIEHRRRQRRLDPG